VNVDDKRGQQHPAAVRAEATPSPSSAQIRAQELIGRVIAGRHRIDRILAMGGMGAVFCAEHVHMRKRFAVKLLHPETRNLPDLVTRFERESIVGAHASHPNVTSATDFGKLEDGSYYLVLEFVDGITLHELMKRGAMPWRRAADIARQIACGLEAIHRLDIFHRDLKPRNIMVIEGTPDTVKIIDFGFAKVPLERFTADATEAINVTARGMVFGTVGYMAPETAYGMHAVTAQSDLYALGVILYELLSGVHPFEPKEPRALFECHSTQKPPRIHKRAPGVSVPAPLEQVVLRLLEKQPRDRHATAREVIEAIDAALAEPDAPADVRESPPPAVPVSRDEGDHSPPPAEADPRPMPAQASRGPLILGLIALLGALMLGVYYRLPHDQRDRIHATLGIAPPQRPATNAAPPRGTSTANTNAKATASAPAAEPAATQTASAPSPAASLPPASTGSIDGLDATKWRGIIRDAATAMDPSRGAKAFLALAELDPRAFGDPEIIAAAASAAIGVELGHRDTADKIYGLLGSDTLGSGGPDVLYQMTSYYGGSRGARRAAEMLQRPDVMARATPALKIALALRDTPCKDRPTLYEQAVRDGDERTTSLMSKMITPDCDGATGACCRKHDPQLADAFGKLRARLHK
jgi:serine/threonine-protein kinase